MQSMTKTRALVVSAILWEGCFCALCVAPLPELWNPHDGVRQLGLLVITAILFAHGIAAALAVRSGFQLQPLSFVLLGTPLLYLIAAASQPNLAWTSVVLAGLFLLFISALTWRSL